MSKSSESSTRPRRFTPARGAVGALTLLFLALPLVLVGIRGAHQSASNDPRQWLPRGFDETERLGWFRELFGGDEISVVTWPDCKLGDPTVDELAAALTTNLPPGETRRFESAFTGNQIIERLTSEPLNLSRQEAIHRLTGTLVGADGQTTCLVLVFPRIVPEKPDRVAAVQQIYRVAESEFSLEPEVLRLGGPTVDAATIDNESEKLMLTLTGLSVLIAFAITWWQLGSFRMATLVLVGAVYSAGVSLAILYYSGGRMNLVLVILPPLVYVLSISAAVHLVNYYRDAIAEGGAVGAAGRAIAQGWLPCLLASLTSAIGLLSLATSTVVPVRQFGIYSALGMTAGYVVLLLFLPSMLTLWPILGRKERRAVAQANAARRAEENGDDGTEENVETGEIGAAAANSSGGGLPLPCSPLVERVTSFLIRFHAPVTIGCVVMMVLLGIGLTRLESTVKLQHRFAPDSRILTDYAWMEEHLGPLIPLEVVICFDDTCRLDTVERIEFIAQLEQRIAGFDDVKATMSTADFAPALADLPRSGGLRDAGARSVLRRGLLKSGFLAEDAQGEHWRISVRANAMGDVDYGLFIETLATRIDPLLAEHPAGGMEAVYTGVIPLIYKAQRTLFGDLYRSFLLAFAVIAVVMMIALRSIRSGLLAMAPNVFPAVIVFGFMGWAGLLVEIGSVMTASVALGIAVDDTFHFLAWFHRGMSQGLSRNDSIRFAYQRCARAMFNTTIICGGGLMIFAVSSFMPIVHFSQLMVTLLVAALVGDLFFLPAMLAGPAGLFFQRRLAPFPR